MQGIWLLTQNCGGFACLLLLLLLLLFIYFGGTIVGRHDEVKYELADIATKAYNPSSIRDEPRTNPFHEGEQNDSAVSSPDNYRADILIRGLWRRGTDGLIDIKIVNTDSKTHINRTPEAVLKSSEASKKRKHLRHCLLQRRDFTPFVASTDGLLGKEATALIKRLASLLAIKWEKPYSHTCGWVRSRIAIALVRATHRCIRGSRIPHHHISDTLTHPAWEDGAGLHLTQW